MVVIKCHTPKEVAERIGRKYVENDRLMGEDTEAVRDAYGEIGRRVTALESRIPVPVRYQPGDPYDDYRDMAETVGSEQMLRVYNQHTDHPFLSHDEQLAFRAVHDWFGHLSADVDFTPEGEFRKWDHMKRHFSDKANRVMFAEVVGQVGAVHYLEDGFADDRYEQRAFFAPKRWIRWMKTAVEYDG